MNIERLKELLDYNPETGKFIWKVNSGRYAKAGGIAGHVRHDGRYIHICVDYKTYLGHRLAWFYTFGIWPSQTIDHINGNGLDNRLSNLREATLSQNMWNRKRHKNNTSGIPGVTRHRDRWKVKVNGMYFGLYDSKEEAAKARGIVADNLHGNFRKKA